MATSKRRKKQAVHHLNGFTLRDIVPKTEAQKDTVEAFNEGYNLILHGTAGSGKSFISLFLALKKIITSTEHYQKVIIIRSCVPTRNVGFLPGDLKEKTEIYEEPYKIMINELFHRNDAYNHLKEKGILEFTTTSFLRGITFNNCVLVVDEIQNMNFEELNTIITRIGQHCKVIFAGDIKQTDLYRTKTDISGFNKFLKIIDSIEDEFDIIEYTPDDIVRSGLVKKYILAKEKLEEQESNESNKPLR